MIQSKEDLDFYLEADRIALGRSNRSSLRDSIVTRFIVPDEVWEFEKLLRKCEYLRNCHHDKLSLLRFALLRRRLHRYQLMLGFYVSTNIFGPGLSISHPGTIIVNGAARVGANCRVHPGLTIGTEAGYDDRAPHLGDNVYIGPGVKIFGQIEIADNIAIGANSVVNRSFTEPGITIAGVPARKVSDKDSSKYIIKATDLARRP